MLKRIFIVAVMFAVLPITGQRLEITPQYGYQVGAKWNYYGGYVKLKSSDQYGLTASLNLSPEMQAEFLWVQQNSAVSIKDVIYFPREEEVSDIRVNHYQFGVIYKFGRDELVPFAEINNLLNQGAYHPISNEWLTSLCEWLKQKEDEKDIWIQNIANVSKYIKERDSYSYQVIAQTNTQIEIDLTDTLNNEIYKVSLVRWSKQQ